MESAAISDTSTPGSGGERAVAVAQRLAEVIGEPLAGPIKQLSSGASRETFAFVSAAGRRLVAQLEQIAEKPGGGPPPQAPLLQAAAAAGVPVPRVVAHGGPDPVLGPAWIVLDALAGTTDPTLILAGEGVPAPAQLLDDIAAALARVHRMPPDAALARVVEDPLAQLRQQHDQLGEPHATFELAFRALDGRRPPPGRRALVHGDFRLGNLMVASDGVSGVLDWELTHVGDPVEDLGWLCVPAWRFARRERPAAGLGSRAELIAAYERHAGVAVDADALRWWELAGTLRWGVICVMQAQRHLSGATPSIEHAVIGRRACEVEWDLLQLLAPQPNASAAAAEQPPSPRRPAQPGPPPQAEQALPPPQVAQPPRLHDRPTALELLDAARATLGEELLPLLDGRTSFELRVTMRALGMVRRELAHAPRHAAVHAAALERLGARDESELAAAVRAGAFDGREEQLIAALREVVRAKLEVANPRYEGVASKAAEEEAR